MKKKRFKKDEILGFERALLAEKRRILKERDFNRKVMDSVGSQATGDLSAHRSLTADQGTENYQREHASRMRSLETKTLREISDALDRISKGTYGTCEKCGKPIPRARLKAVPHARFCMKCMKAAGR